MTPEQIQKFQEIVKRDRLKRQEQMKKCAETQAKVRQSMKELDQADKMLDAIIQE